MRKGFFAAFVAALSIFTAIPSYAMMTGIPCNPFIDAAGFYHDGVGWKCRTAFTSEDINLYAVKNLADVKLADAEGWKLINGRFYHMDPETYYCDLGTTKTIRWKDWYGKFVDDGQASFDKTGALTENGVVVDLGHKDGEFTFSTCKLEKNSNGKYTVNKNFAYEIEKKALELGIRPTGEKLYMGDVVSEDNYCGWVITGPGVNKEISEVAFWDCTAGCETTLKKMREHPERTYELRLDASDVRDMRVETVLWGTIPPTSSLVPAGYLPTP